MSSPVPSAGSRPRRIAWGIAGIPISLVVFALFVMMLFSWIGGGSMHLMFAYTPGGSLSGARVVFVGYILATAFIMGFLRWTRYPLPWKGRALVAGAIALCAWLFNFIWDSAGPAFRLQGLLLAPLLPLTAFAVGAWSERRRRPRRVEKFGFSSRTPPEGPQNGRGDGMGNSRT